MKLTIDIEHQDLATIAPEEFSALLSVVQRIAIGSAGVKPTESTPKTPKTTKAAKVSQNNETTAKSDSGKPEKASVDTTKADPEPKEEESAQAPETKEEQILTRAPMIDHKGWMKFDSPHKVAMVFPDGAELHRFNNQVGAPYSAIYRKAKDGEVTEVGSCDRIREDGLIKWYQETELKTEKEDAPAEAVDRKAIVDRVKKITFEGKAQGAPGKIKAILQGYGVSKLSDLPDDKLEELLAKVEAL